MSIAEEIVKEDMLLKSDVKVGLVLTIGIGALLLYVEITELAFRLTFPLSLGPGCRVTDAGVANGS